MGNKTKQRLKIIALGWYLTLTTWIGTFVYNNYLVDGYEFAYYLTLIFHYTSIYFVIMHYFIEGKDK